MKTALTLALLFFLPLSILAQITYKTGYVVYNNNDTTKGFLKDDDELGYFKGVTFAKSSGGEASAYLTTATIKGFGFNGGNSFEEVHYTNGDGVAADVFAQAVLSGYYRLFTFKANTYLYFAIKTNDDSLYLLYDDQQSVMGDLLKEGNYKNTLSFLSAGCDNLKDRLINFSYSAGEIINYVQLLNKCKSPSTASTLLVKKAASQLKLYVYAGGITLGNSNSELTGRLIAKILTPSIDKKSSINIGINYLAYSHLEQKTPSYDLPYWAQSTLKEDIIEVPFTLQYNFSKGIIQPYVNVGPSLVYQHVRGGFDNAGYLASPKNQFGVGLAAAIGIECPITHSLYIKADWTYELILHYPTIGISYFLK